MFGSRDPHKQANRDIRQSAPATEKRRSTLKLRKVARLSFHMTSARPVDYSHVQRQSIVPTIGYDHLEKTLSEVGEFAFADTTDTEQCVR